MTVSTTPINIWPNWTATIGTARRIIARSSARKVIGIAGMSDQNVCQATTSARRTVSDFPRTSRSSEHSNLYAAMSVRVVSPPRAAAMPRTIVLLLVLGAIAGPLVAQNIHPTTPPVARAVPLQGEIKIDGKLDEPIWQSAPPATDFRQNQPHEGQPATQRTEVRFVFDAAAIYVGARMYDDSGSRGVRTRLVRRDADASSDYVQVIFDTYHDHIGRLFFLVNPSGVKNDANGLGGGGDDSWDPVWEVKTTIDSLGWTAEMRIPFSQLRYPETTKEQTWGLQMWRQENRLNENSQWSFWGLTETGGPPRFGHLEGLVITRAPGKAEILPYMVGQDLSLSG